MGIAFRELQHCNNRNMRLVFSLYTTRTVMQNSDRASHFWNKLPVDFTDTQRLNKIGNLLMRMKRDGAIKIDEKRMWHSV